MELWKTPNDIQHKQRTDIQTIKSNDHNELNKCFTEVE